MLLRLVDVYTWIFTFLHILWQFLLFFDIEIRRYAYLLSFRNLLYFLLKLFFAPKLKLAVISWFFLWWRFAKPVDVRIHHETDELYAARKHREEVIRFFCHNVKWTMPRARSGAVSKWVICACDSLVDFGTVWMWLICIFVLLTFPICIFPSSFFMRLIFSSISSSISYLPEYWTRSVSRQEVVGGDQTWV